MRLPQLSSMRFILILMIFLHHMNLFSGGGAIGVASFFVLSGFCMTLGYNDTIISTPFEKFDYLKYLKKRIIKFIPLHWICLLVVVLLNLPNGEIENIPILVSNFTLTQSWIPIQDYYFSFNALSWYLSNTVFLSIIFPFLALLFTQKKKNTIIVLCVGIYIVLVMSVPPSLRHALLYINPICRTIDFMLGIWLATQIMMLKKHRVFIEKCRYMPDLLFLFSLTILAILGFIVDEKYLPIAGIFWPLIITMIASVSLMHNTPLSRFLSSNLVQKLTQCTFSFYMLHNICRDFITRFLPDSSLCLRIAIIFTITYLISQISYYCIEKKLNNQLQLWLIKS